MVYLDKIFKKKKKKEKTQITECYGKIFDSYIRLVYLKYKKNKIKRSYPDSNRGCSDQNRK